MSSVCLEEGRARQSCGLGLWSKVRAFLNSTGRDGLEEPHEVKSPGQRVVLSVSARRSTRSLALSPLENDLSSEDSEDTSTKYTEAESEAACAKLWAIYVAEAEKYDKRLVESWKGDMDGMLIFSGLFSASLTAFLVESYTTLQPDPGATNAALLTQISRQLAGSLNGTEIPFEEPLPFHPTTAALVCNILWFLSLALSLTCALLATMVEQWAREFIHKSELRPSPARRVRIHSFLYLGLQKFGMYAIVDLIPLLLHASLIIFFAGLIFFLLPVNPLLMRLMSFVLATFVVLYVTLTALPVIFLESPYQTPLSKGVWKFWQFSTALITTKLSKNMRPRIFSPLTMTQAMERRSQQNPKSRDQHAIQWTVAALTDDSELLPFVEAIPDIVHGAKGFHRANDYLLNPLLCTQEPHIAIWPRVINLLRSSAIIPSADPLRIPRLTICFRAIWALAKSRGEQTLSVASSPTAFYFDRETFRALEDPSLDGHYTISVRAAVRHKLLADLKARCQSVLECLDGWETASISSRRITCQLIQSVLVTVLKEGEFYAVNLDIGSQEIFRALQACYTLDIDPSRDARNAVAVATTGDEIAKAKKEVERTIQNQRQTLVSLRDTLRSKRGWANANLAPLSWYLRDSVNAGLLPYEFELTIQDFMESVTDADRSGHAHSALESLISVSNYSPEMDILAKVVFRLLPLVDPKKFGSSINGIYHYLLHRNADDEILHYLIGDDSIFFMASIVRDVHNGASDSCLRTIWLLVTWTLSQNLDEESDVYKVLMDFTRRLCHQLPGRALLKSDIQSFVLALVQWVEVSALSDQIVNAQEEADPASSVTVDDIWVKFRTHPLLLAFFPNNAENVDPGKSPLDIYSDLGNQVTEVSLMLATTFLRAYSTNSSLFSAEKPLISALERQCRTHFEGVVSAEAQRSFASGILLLIKRLEDNPTNTELSQVVKNTWSASYYWSWLNDPTCASILTEALNLCDTTGWSKNNSDSQSYIHSLRLRCLELWPTDPVANVVISGPRCVVPCLTLFVI